MKRTIILVAVIVASNLLWFARYQALDRRTNTGVYSIRRIDTELAVSCANRHNLTLLGPWDSTNAVLVSCE
ncbi:MAG TPA: hypothetical protein VI386_17835 [Candidatus Sulfotelmatobacter sp.]